MYLGYSFHSQRHHTVPTSKRTVAAVYYRYNRALIDVLQRKNVICVNKQPRQQNSNGFNLPVLTGSQTNLGNTTYFTNFPRSTTREIFYDRATINVRPTKKGMKEIGEDHDIYTMKYLRNKPIRSLEYDQFLRLKVFFRRHAKLSNTIWAERYLSFYTQRSSEFYSVRNGSSARDLWQKVWTGLNFIKRYWISLDLALELCSEAFVY